MSLYDGLGLDQDEISDSIEEVKIPEKQPEKKVEPPKVEIPKLSSSYKFMSTQLQRNRIAQSKPNTSVSSDASAW
jgi:NACalpha-BTF3-like transcription factor